MKKRIISIVTSIVLLCTILFNLGGCIMVHAVDLMEGVTPNAVSVSDDLKSYDASVTDFALRLFRATDKGGNTFISPFSVLCALAMTSNGAEGETLKEMESVMGMTSRQLNEYLYCYVKGLSDTDKSRLRIANSIWFTNDEKLQVNRGFLQKNADYYGAEIYKVPFDNKALWDINTWVRKETEGMVPKIIDTIPKDAIMYLINTLAFEAEWPTYYKDYQVRKGAFTMEDGTEQDAEFMYCNEGRYLECDNASGFIKYYSGGKYAFAALLPNRGVSLSDCLASLDGEKLNNMLANPIRATVKTAIPKFKTDYETEMSQVLTDMGMPLAFDPDHADFSSLGVYGDGTLEYVIYISRVLHKSYIQVGERGTKAGAATVIEMSKNESAEPPLDPKEVYLDRPFVYMIIDTQNNIPLFIGTMTDIDS